MTSIPTLAELSAAFGGVRILTNPHLVIGPFEDWSQVRSHGRAARRRRQGHPQRIRFYYKPDPKVLQLPDGSLVMHPEIEASLRDHLQSGEYRAGDGAL